MVMARPLRLEFANALYHIIGNPTLADAILDRLVHNAYKINLTGESTRKNRQGQTLLNVS